jgi:hypothetical protein
MNTKKLDEWREAARRKAQELDERFELSNKLEQGFNAATDAARKATDTAAEVAAAARDQATKLDAQFQVTENLRAAQTEAEEFSRTAEEKARAVFGDAQTYYRRAGQAYGFGAGSARLTEATLAGYEKARVWIRENPGKTAVVSLSLIAGVRAGSALPGLGLTLLGAGGAGHWLFHSALPIVGMRKLTERYNDYLKAQEQRIANGELDEAERERVEFQRNLTKYVGAPLLGAFSVAAGATLIATAFSGATVTGFPVSLLLGANPLLNGIWFFANGVVCISEGYKFFMIALADQDEVARVVREIKGLLPA